MSHQYLLHKNFHFANEIKIDDFFLLQIKSQDIILKKSNFL